LNDIGGHEGSRVVVALQQSGRNIPLNLQPKKVPSVFLLNHRWVWSVEFNAKSEQWLMAWESNLMVELFVHIKPILQKKNIEKMYIL
jgi:hypothetical protein